MYNKLTIIGLMLISANAFPNTLENQKPNLIEYYTEVPYNKCRQLIGETYKQSGARKSEVRLEEFKYSESFSTTEKKITMICYKPSRMVTQILPIIEP